MNNTTKLWKLVRDKSIFVFWWLTSVYSKAVLLKQNQSTRWLDGIPVGIYSLLFCFFKKILLSKRIFKSFLKGSEGARKLPVYENAQSISKLLKMLFSFRRRWYKKCWCGVSVYGILKFSLVSRPLQKEDSNQFFHWLKTFSKSLSCLPHSKHYVKHWDRQIHTHTQIMEKEPSRRWSERVRECGLVHRLICLACTKPWIV